MIATATLLPQAETFTAFATMGCTFKRHIEKTVDEKGLWAVNPYNAAQRPPRAIGQLPNSDLGDIRYFSAGFYGGSYGYHNGPSQ